MTATATCCDTDLYLPQPATIAAKALLTPADMQFDLRLDSGRPLDHLPGQFV
jgi:hypothetical protein